MNTIFASDKQAPGYLPEVLDTLKKEVVNGQDDLLRIGIKRTGGYLNIRIRSSSSKRRALIRCPVDDNSYAFVSIFYGEEKCAKNFGDTRHPIIDSERIDISGGAHTTKKWLIDLLIDELRIGCGVNEAYATNSTFPVVTRMGAMEKLGSHANVSHVKFYTGEYGGVAVLTNAYGRRVTMTMEEFRERCTRIN